MIVSRGGQEPSIQPACSVGRLGLVGWRRVARWGCWCAVGRWLSCRWEWVCCWCWFRWVGSTGQRALVLGMAGRMADSAGGSRVARALPWPRGQRRCPSLWQLHSRGGGLKRVHTQGGWIAASHPSKRAGCRDARASGSRGVQQRPTARGHVSEAVSRGTRSHGAAGVLNFECLPGGVG